jgi:transcriptional regulator with GAF, ATPase, and Fis domain
VLTCYFGTVDDDQGDEQSTVTAPRLAPSPMPRAAFVLRLEADPAREFVVDGSAPSRVLLGKSTACAIKLTDRMVSRRHAALDVVGDRLKLTDLGSTNGTQINGLAVNEAFLAGGERLAVGRSVLLVERRPIGAPPALAAGTQFGRVLGESTEIRRLYPLGARLAGSDVPVIIEGETGTGKELFAEALHEEGPRAQGPFVVFDCTAVPSSLVESELFGHERGAFTGAVAQRKGCFELADGGTLLVDEIGDLDLTLQPKLLRAIERSEIRRVGGTKTIRVNVRILAATRRDLDREVAAGRFRDDLFHRLAVARLELPPLRERRGDIAVLARHFWKALGGRDNDLDPEVVHRWEAYAWPGNVRELRNAVARYHVLGTVAVPRSKTAAAAGGEDIDILRRVLAGDLPFPEARDAVLAAFERLYVAKALAEHGGNMQRAAAASGIARRYFALIRARHER